MHVKPKRRHLRPTLAVTAALLAVGLVACQGPSERTHEQSTSVVGAPTICPAPATPPSVLLVDANPGLTPATEIGTIESYLSSLGYAYTQIDEPRTAGASWYDDPGLTPAQVAPFDIVIYDTKGWRWHSAESRDTLKGALAAGKRVFMIGDDTAWGIPDLEPLTHLTGSGYDQNGDPFPASTVVSLVPNTFLSAGPSAGAQGFTYKYDVDVASRTNQGETLLATVRNGAPAILSYGTASGGRAIVSLVGIAAAEGTVATDAGLASLRKLFENGMAHLAASGTCDAQCPPNAPLVGPDGGSCVAACPAGTYDDDGRCVATCPVYHTDTTCVDACPSPSFVDGNACVDACPADRFVEGNTCVAQCSKFRRGRYCVDRCPAFHLGRLCVAACPAYSHRKACVASCPTGTFVSGPVCVNRCPAETAPNADGVCVAKVATSLTVTQRSNLALIVGAPTSYRVHVRDASGAPVTTGTLTVTVGGTMVQQSPVTSGTVDVSHTYTAVGQQVIRFNYAGDGYKRSSHRDVVWVRKAPTTITVASQVAAPVFSHPNSFVAQVTSGVAAVGAGTVTFAVDGHALNYWQPELSTVAVTNGGASIDYAGLAPGVHTVTATFSGTATLAPSTATVQVTASKAPMQMAIQHTGSGQAYGCFPVFSPPSIYARSTPYASDTNYLFWGPYVAFYMPMHTPSTPVPASVLGTTTWLVDGVPYTSANAQTLTTPGPHTLTCAFSGSDYLLPIPSATYDVVMP